MSGMALAFVIVFFVFLSALTCLVTVVLFNTLMFRPRKADARAAPWEPGTVDRAALDRLSGAIAIPTVSSDDYEATPFAPFRAYIAYVKQTWPLFHERTGLVLINEYTLLFRLPGRDANTEKKPLIFTAHYDVVPVVEESAWTWPGFSGKVDGERVWGRGTLDIKSQMCAHLEAVENLLRRGWQPERDFYFIYGHDEEVGGRNGALKAAEYLKNRGVRAEGVLDEGGFVISGALRGVAAPLALIGIAEKGFCNYEITVEGEGGHSSMPPRHTSLGTAAALVRAIEETPLPARITPPVRDMLRAAAGEMGFPVRMALANLRLFKRLLLGVLDARAATRAMAVTSLSATMARAGNAANVLPQKTVITINARILHGDTVAQVEKYLARLAEKVIRNDRKSGEGIGKPDGPGFSIKKIVPEEPSPISPAAGPVYERLRSLTGEMFPNAIITPYLVMGGTDARKYYAISDHVYRFTPILVSDAEKNTAHGVDESISVINYGRMIHFFERFLAEFH
ncbi:MAG: M20/M25/M40 family metallo-hydrolase [Spirochaetaceae bacterium]|jgi:carboxypeptidase PM20D1|nr:M20/M25/M40 family metallo-hydrolase [Spirochaetaceae bacterium]